MAIRVEHQPNFVDYGQAVARAAEQAEGSNRLKEYANFLKGMQSQQQAYSLGLGELGVKQQQANIAQQAQSSRERALDLEEFRNNLAAQQFEVAIQRGEVSDLADLLRAQGSLLGGYGNIMQGMSGYGYY